MKPELLTLHSRLPRIVGNSAEHGSQVGPAGAWAVVGRLLRAGTEVAAAAAGRWGMAVPRGVRGRLDPATQRQQVRPKCEKSALRTSSLGLAYLRKTPSAGFVQPTRVPQLLMVAQRGRHPSESASATELMQSRSSMLYSCYFCFQVISTKSMTPRSGVVCSND